MVITAVFLSIQAFCDWDWVVEWVTSGVSKAKTSFTSRVKKFKKIKAMRAVGKSGTNHAATQSHMPEHRNPQEYPYFKYCFPKTANVTRKIMNIAGVTRTSICWKHQVQEHIKYVLSCRSLPGFYCLSWCRCLLSYTTAHSEGCNLHIHQSENVKSDNYNKFVMKIKTGYYLTYFRFVLSPSRLIRYKLFTYYSNMHTTTKLWL